MKIFFFAILLPLSAHASWLYNENGGFGIYRPEGWTASIDGRSSQLRGPESDSDQSEIFLGSDWVSGVRTLSDLRKFAVKDSGTSKLFPYSNSGLLGYRAGDSEHGALYVLRIPENVIEVKFQLRGSRAQIDEGETMVSSLEIRTKGIEQ
jgi:hypothetical protein